VIPVPGRSPVAMTIAEGVWHWLTDGSHWTGRNPGILHRLAEHAQLSLLATVLAIAVAVPPALWLGHTRRGGLLAVSIVNIGRAIPSYGILVVVNPFFLRWGFDLGYTPTLVTVWALALPPIFVNTYTGVRGVDPTLVEAARGMGLRGRQILGQVELPVALPLIITGIRIAAVQVIATATLGALAGWDGLGRIVTDGFAAGRSFDGRVELVSGAVLVAGLAIVVDVAFALVQRYALPRGLVGPRRAR
jgi:osmoprotectant transport system permease protein